jgi:O-antigen ligase
MNAPTLPVALPHRPFWQQKEWWLIVLSAIALGTYGAGWGTDLIYITAIPPLVWLARRYRMLPIWLLSIEMVMGGWGHVLDFRGLPIRHALFFMVMGVWAINKALDRDFVLRGGRHTLAALGFVAFVTIAMLVSVGLDNPEAISDGSTAYFLLLILPFADQAARPGGVHALFRCFLICIFLLAIVQIGLAVGVLIGRIDADRLFWLFLNRFGGVSLVAGPFFRVFIVGSIYFQVVLLMVGAGLLAGRWFFDRTRDWVLFLTVGLSLLFTYTRGFWATAIIGFGVLAALTSSRGRMRWMGAALGAALLLVLVVPMTNIGLVDAVGGRIMNTFDPDRDVSVALRIDLYPRLLRRIADRPWLGYGFGLPVENQIYYENSYLYYALKFGVVGLFVLAIPWVIILHDGVRLSRRHPDPRARSIAVGITAAAVSMLTVTSINPFINSGVGFYFQALVAAGLYGLALPPESRALETHPDAT